MTKKTFIRTLWFDDMDTRDMRQEQLNDAGFYCLRVDATGLEVWALEAVETWEDKLLNLFTRNSLSCH